MCLHFQTPKITTQPKMRELATETQLTKIPKTTNQKSTAALQTEAQTFWVEICNEPN